MDPTPTLNGNAAQRYTPEEVANETAELPFDGIDEAKRLFELQQAHRWAMAHTTPQERIARLYRFRDAINAHREELCQATFKDFRKHPTETEVTEIQPTMLEIQHMASHLEEWLEPKPVKTPLYLAGTRSEIRYEPRGNVLVLGPWNYPFQLVAMPIIAAVASGNVVIARPSEKVPHTGAVLKKIVKAAFDEREVALVLGDIPLADELLDLPFDHIFFTGSTRVGKHVMSKAAKNLASVTLELGGKSPTIVDETANLKDAAERIVWGKFVNAGQTCIAPDYVLVHEKVQGPLIEELRKSIQRAYGDTEEARKQSKDLARIITPHAARRLKTLMDEAVQKGARVDMGGQVDADQAYVAPTLLSGVSPSAGIMQEEIFGPVLPILTWTSWEQVFSSIHKLGKPLALYVFSKKEKNVEQVLRNTTAGGTTINNTLMHFVNSNLPFGGVNGSGMGSIHGEAGIRTFTHARAVLRQGRPNAIRMLLPPYSEKTKRIARLLERLFA